VTALELDVRLLEPDELLPAATLVSSTMLQTTDPEVMAAWVDRMQDRVVHGAVRPDGRVVGTAQWFPADVSFAGGASRPAALVTAVAVAADHRRRGVLTRLMELQMASVREAEAPIALLRPAEWPIYGRWGYGPAIESCTYEVDARSARFTAQPTGAIELVTPDELVPHLMAVHEVRWAHTAGAVTRDEVVWSQLAGAAARPGQAADLGQNRAAIWRDASGAVQGAVAYAVEDRWERSRPVGRVAVSFLVGTTPEAERELWRHLCEIDWVATVVAEMRGVDDELPHHLVDARAATQLDRYDHIWARVLDVPAVLGARRSPLPGRVVAEVIDDLGFAAGRWSIELAPDGAEITRTTSTAEVELPAAALGALCLGGTSATQLHRAGQVAEVAPGAVARLDQLLRTTPAPWSTTTY